MEKIYKYELTSANIEKIQKQIKQIQDAFLSKDFAKFIGRKLRYRLKRIQQQKLSTINSKEDIKASTYMNSNHLKIEEGVIYIYNDAMIDISSKNMSETTKANYPAQLSLAKIVEYGIGYTGGMNANGEEEDWAYDVNQHGSAGWYYRDNSGEVHWTNGFAGRYIFLELKQFAMENAQEWVEEYLSKVFK